jgi:formate--tetrahydrofolate ligase
MKLTSHTLLGSSSIGHIVEKLDLLDDEFELYGKDTGKIRLNVLDRLKDAPNGKLVVVTAMTPTIAGEGKTLTTIGLGQALTKIGRKALVALREPSLGPVFGAKGGATGAGKAQVIPREKINLHFNGDFHAITAAHNLLAAMIDSHIHHGNALKLDVNNIFWTRAVDMNDRALRQVIVGLGGKTNGVPRETGFVITAASEVMAIFCLANSLEDLKRRLGDIAVGVSTEGKLVQARDLNAHGAMTALLKDAFKPNLVQTTEGTPAIVHGGPFANIAHGTNSIIATKIALKLGEFVVTESGFGADLGAEKFFDIVCGYGGFSPAAAVLVATTRALKIHGGVQGDIAELSKPNRIGVMKGLANLKTHVNIIQKFGVPVCVSVNRFSSDVDEELEAVMGAMRGEGIPCVVSDIYQKGGSGAQDLAEAIVAVTERIPTREFAPLYNWSLPIDEKISKVATEIYGAERIYIERKAKRQIEKLNALGYAHLPVCVAKTQYSLSDNPKMLGVPKGWTLTVREVLLAAGAGFIIVIAGDVMLMPGLGKTPGAERIDVDERGEIVGLF